MAKALASITVSFVEKAHDGEWYFGAMALLNENCTIDMSYHAS